MENEKNTKNSCDAESCKDGEKKKQTKNNADK